MTADLSRSGAAAGVVAAPPAAEPEVMYPAEVGVCILWGVGTMAGEGVSTVSPGPMAKNIALPPSLECSYVRGILMLVQYQPSSD